MTPATQEKIGKSMTYSMKLNSKEKWGDKERTRAGFLEK